MHANCVSLVLTLCLAMAWATGCSSESVSPFVSLDQAKLSFAEAIAKSDELWQEELEKFNRGEDRDFVKDQGPFEVKDYRKSISLSTREGRPEMWIFYQYRKPVDFLGHPEHFYSTIYLDTGEVRLTGGQ